MTATYAFLTGIALGGILVWLWLRTRIAELRTAREFSEHSLQQMGETFRALADSALRANQSAFLDAARGTLETVRAEMAGDLTQRQTAIEGLVKPLGESLEKLDGRIRELDRERSTAFGAVKNELDKLSRETLTLSSALRSPQSRGRWGELTLRRVVELAGMVRRCDFAEQVTGERDGNRYRPDLVIHLPGNRSIAVDAKVPLTGYVEAVEAKDEMARSIALDRHAKQVSAHVQQLSGKQYWSQFQPAPELVILFLPGDHFLTAALEGNPELLEDAFAKKVVIATPGTLVSVLKGIAYNWDQHELARNADEIRRVATEFSDRLQSFFDTYFDMGKQIERLIDAYNKTVGSWDARVLPALRRIRELGIRGGEPEMPEPIEKTIRDPRQATLPYSEDV